MHQTPTNRRLDRRPPVLGVGGITLLMVVTMVLTGPALGRSLGPAAPGSGGFDLSSQRMASTDGAGHRLGGRRQMSSNQVRPVGGGIIIAMSRPERTLASVRSVAPFCVNEVPALPTDLVGERLLNLPPPSAR